MTRNIALIYVRKSLITKGTTAASPEIQIQACQARAVELGYKTEIYQDIDGHNTGLTDDRPQWLKLRQRMAKPDVAAVICHSWDRALRNTKLLLAMVDECDALNVRFISTADNIDTRTADGRFTVTVISATNEHYSRRVSEKRIASIDYLRRVKGRHYGLAPFGTERVQANGDRVLVPSTRVQANGTDYQALQQVYEMWLRERRGARWIAAELNTAGWRYRDRHGELREWNKDDIRRVLVEHWIYAGYVVIGRSDRGQSELVPGSHAAILPESLTGPVAARFATFRKHGPRQREPIVYPLSGVLYCTCGAKLVGSSARGRYRYYQHTALCAQGLRFTVRAEPLEALAREKLASLKFPQVIEQSVGAILAVEHNREAGDTDAQIVRVQGSLARLKDLYVSGDLTKEEYATRKTALLERMPSEKPPKLAPEVAALAGLPQSWLTCPAPVVRDAARELWERVEVVGHYELRYTPLAWCAKWAG